jgi:hypothetical protein
MAAATLALRVGPPSARRFKIERPICGLAGGAASHQGVEATLEQDRFGWKHLTSTETSRPKRDSCSIPWFWSKIRIP